MESKDKWRGPACGEEAVYVRRHLDRKSSAFIKFFVPEGGELINDIHHFIIFIDQYHYPVSFFNLIFIIPHHFI